MASPALPTILFAVDGGQYIPLSTASFGTYALTNGETALTNGETDGISYGLLGSSASESLTEARLIDVSGSLTNTNSTAMTVDLVFSSTGFTTPIAPPELYFTNKLGGAIIGTMPVSILSAPYGLYQTLAISMPAGSSVEFSNNAAVNAPEPGTVALLGVGILGLGFACRRRLA